MNSRASHKYSVTLEFDLAVRRHGISLNCVKATVILSSSNIEIDICLNVRKSMRKQTSETRVLFAVLSKKGC